MSSFSENYDNLKKELNKDQSKLISLLFFGIILGRVYEKFLTIKKSITRRFMNMLKTYHKLSWDANIWHVVKYVVY